MRIELVGPTEAMPKVEAFVVIDVIRAFTTAAFAFESGLTKIVCVDQVDLARRTAATLPVALLFGERHGIAPAGFDLGNSPVEMAGLELAGRVGVFTTSNGTRRLEEVPDHALAFAAGATTAKATVQQICSSGVQSVALVCTGTTQEDRIVAVAIESMLRGIGIEESDVRQGILDCVPDHMALWSGPKTPGDEARFVRDVSACADLDRHEFAMVSRRENGLTVLRVKAGQARRGV